MLGTVLVHCCHHLNGQPYSFIECTRLILLINHVLQIPTNYLPTPSPIATTRSRNDMKFFHYQPTIDCFKYSFFQELSLNGTCHM